MTPVLAVAGLWLLFAATHVGLATGRVRAALVARLGEPGFGALFSVVASVTFAAAVACYAAHRADGPAGPALGGMAAVRWPLIGLIVAGTALVSAGSVGYPGSPYDMFARTVRAPRGIERVTRHPFFAGVALFAVAHMLLATRLVGTVMAGGLALVAIVGTRHQDAKLLARFGRPYAEYLAATSIVPFAAILAGRQRLVWRELPLAPLAIGVVLAAGLRAVHGSIFAHGGAWVIVSVVGAAGIFTWQTWRRTRRTGPPVPIRA